MKSNNPRYILTSVLPWNLNLEIRELTFIPGADMFTMN
jgi:hypothetical protein